MDNNTPLTNEKLITPKQLNDARIISLAKQFEERKAGRLKCFRIGTRVIYAQRHIDEYLALCEAGGPGDVEAGGK